MPISLDEMSYTLKLDKLKEVPASKRKEAKELIGLTVKQMIVDYLDRGTSPVSGGSYQKTLSKEYKKKKLAQGKSGIADLDLEGDMLGNLKFTTSGPSDEINFKLSKKTEILKGYNHNVGDTLPQREWLPDDEVDGQFKPAIRNAIDEIIDGFLDGNN